MSKLTLLDKAIAVTNVRPNRNCYSPEHLELVIAWLTDRISLRQISVVLGKKGAQSSVNFVAYGIREAYRRGLIREAKE